jgi:hypothetical protein
VKRRYLTIDVFTTGCFPEIKSPPLDAQGLSTRQMQDLNNRRGRLTGKIHRRGVRPAQQHSRPLSALWAIPAG